MDFGRPRRHKQSCSPSRTCTGPTRLRSISMRALAERGAQAPLLIVATTRPEFRPPWSVRSHHSVISLSPLDRAQVAKMVAESRPIALRRPGTSSKGRTSAPAASRSSSRRLRASFWSVASRAARKPSRRPCSSRSRRGSIGLALRVRPRRSAQCWAVDLQPALLQSVAGLDEGALQSALERLTQADILFVEGDGAQADYRFKHALIQDAAYDSLLKSRRQALHRRAAEALVEAKAQSEAIAHHFTQAALNDLAIEWWGKAGDQALRRSAFQEAIAHLGKAIAMADMVAGGNTTGLSGQRQQLQVAYGNALIAARGYGAPETTEAFAKARESPAAGTAELERLSADYGLWGGSYTRGELLAMRAHVETFLADTDGNPNSPEAEVAHRTAGITHWFAGEYREARDHLERALALFQPGRDDDLAFRFGHDVGLGAMLSLALALWPLGEIGRAIFLVDAAEARLAGLTHVGTRAFGTMHSALFAMMRGDLSRAAPNITELTQLAREHDLPAWRACAVFFEGWAKAESSAPADELEAMGRAAALLHEQNVLVYDGLIKIALAEAEARSGDVERAVAVLDEALATCERIGHRTFEAELHRVRGNMLLKRDPANPAPAQDAFLTAIAVAKQQATRSFELRAALSLAKLYQSTGRPVDAHAVLAPALEGFSPTPEMPEIAEAQALLAALAEIDEVKVEAAHRQRLTQLHVAHGNALIAARGFGAAETAEAFAKARKSAAGDKDAPERLAAHYGLWAGNFVRGELSAMRAHAETFLGDVGPRPNSPEACVAHRCAGATCWFAGDYAQARDNLERALALFQPGRDDDLAFRFGPDPGVLAMHYLALTLWPMGDIERAVSLVGRAEARIADLTHVGTLAPGRMHAAMFDLMRGDRARVAPNAFELARLAREFDLNLFRAFGVFLEGWASAASGASGSGLEDMRRGVELLREQNVLWFDGLLKMALAEAEAQGGDPDRAVAILDEALGTCDRIGYRAFEAELHRGARRNPAEARPRQPRARRRSSPDGHRGREAARHAQLRTARGAVAGQALSIDSPPHRSPRRPRARARRLFADARNARDRRGAGAADCTRGDRRGQGGGRASAATDAVARRLRQRAHRGARLRSAGNDRSLRQSPRVGVRRQGRARTIGGRLRLVGRQLHARRVAVDAGARGGLPQRRRGDTRFARGRRRPSRRRDHLLVRRGVSRGAGSLGTCARLVPTRPRRRSGLSLRTGPRRRRDGQSGDCVVASRRGRSRDFAHRPHADADGGPHPCRHARVWKNARGPVRIDAWRPRSRRAERVRTRPARA